MKLGRAAFDKAKLARPDTGYCEICGDRSGPRQGHHHKVSFSKLVTLGLHRDPASHDFLWVCEDCHIAQHDGEHVQFLMLGAKNKPQRRQP